MKKTIMSIVKVTSCAIALMMVLSMAACTPTPNNNNAQETKQAESSSAPEKRPDPTAPELDVVSVYSVSEDGTKLEGTMDAVDELNAKALVDLLIQYGVLEEGTEVISYEATGEASSQEVGPGVAASDGGMKEYGTLNLSQFPDSGNEMLLQAVANTFIENMNTVYLTIQVNGETVAENLSMADAGK